VELRDVAPGEFEHVRDKLDAARDFSSSNVF